MRADDAATFHQEPPRLTNAYEDDPLLRQYAARALPDAVRAPVVEELRELGALAAGPLFRQQMAELKTEPQLVQWDPWGRRIDEVTVTPLWEEARQLAARHGLVAAGYEPTHGPFGRVHQFLMNHVVQPSLDLYSCPLAMTDGAVRTLKDTGNTGLMARALPRLLSRDPDTFWTSGQWMTERTGGSDVGGTQTVARRDPDARGGYRLYGVKWFSSATTADMALALARPEGAGPGSRNLALFYLELRDEAGRLRDIRVRRLKDKLGTRKVPTAELALEGAPATPVKGLDGGVRHIASMLNITRTWNAVGATSGMRRAIALATDYARRRSAFGDTLARKPLHVDTLAGLSAEAAGAFLLTFRAIELLGRQEQGDADDRARALFRAMTPIAKLTTGKQAVAVASEALEAFGGAGYVYDTGLPLLLCDAQVLPIWEGTTNVLSLDLLRALRDDLAWRALREEAARELEAARDGSLGAPARVAAAALDRAEAWLAGAREDRAALEAGARRFALTVGRALECALLVGHAQWALDAGHGPYAAAAARRLAASGVDLLAGGGADLSPADARTLVGA